jgi:acyl-CoA synthetase (AMP-forming)/AMP-acid ligase II
VTDTLPGLLARRGDSRRDWLVLPEAPRRTDAARRLSFEEVYLAASQIARAFQQNGAEPGRVVALVANNSPEFIYLLFGAWLAGLVPAPLHLPFFVMNQGEYAERVRHMLVESNAQFLAVGDDFGYLVDSVGPGSWTSKTFGALRELGGASGRSELVTPRISGDDTALIQFSSGSTRVPLGVELRHRNVLANVEALGRAVPVAEQSDVALTWLPLFHDMGLSGTLLHSWYWGIPLVLLTPQDFVTAPASWLWAIHRFRVTGTAAPNFAYALCCDRTRVRDESISGLDLSTWRAAFNGAELIHADTVARFQERFASYGFRGDTLCSAYGLAENVVACCISPYGREPRVDRIDRRMLETSGEARPAGHRDPSQVRAVVSTGVAIHGTSIRVVDATGASAGERRIGAIELRGESMMKGYVGRPNETARAFTPDGWLRTGDLGYLVDGELYVVGRSKQVIKKAGAKLDAADIQSLVSEVPGIRAGCVAAFGLPGAPHDTEGLAIVAETRLTSARDLEELEARARKAVLRTFGTTVDVVRFLSPGSLPKTSSGKVQAERCRDLVASGELSPIWPLVEPKGGPER